MVDSVSHHQQESKLTTICNQHALLPQSLPSKIPNLKRDIQQIIVHNHPTAEPRVKLISNSCIELLKTKSSFEIQYDSLGVISQIVIFDPPSMTIIPRASDDFEGLLAYIDEYIGRPQPKFTWIETIRDEEGNFLHYRTDKGRFVDIENEVTIFLKQQIDKGTSEIRDPINESPTIALEANIFLPRAYSFLDTQMRQLERYDFEVDEIELPFRAQVSILQTIESEFLTYQEFISPRLKNLSGNVVRIHIPSKKIASIYKWAFPLLDASVAANLRVSESANLALYKRSTSHGPTSSWYFDYITVECFLWAPILETANRIINFFNLQAHRKTMSLFSRDDLGDVVSIKEIKKDGTYYLRKLGVLDDTQINIIPHNLNWKHDRLSLSLYRVRYLLDRSLYLEALVVAQAVLEAIVNGMFSPELTQRLFGKKEIR